MADLPRKISNQAYIRCEDIAYSPPKEVGLSSSSPQRRVHALNCVDLDLLGDMWNSSPLANRVMLLRPQKGSITDLYQISIYFKEMLSSASDQEISLLLHNIKYISIPVQLELLEFQRLLKCAQDLNYFEISPIFFRTHEVVKGVFAFLKEDGLNQLETLVFRMKGIQASDVIMGIYVSPNLKQLYVSACKLTQENNFLNLLEKSLDKLEKMKLSQLQVTADDMKAFLRAASNLKKLSIERCSAIQPGEWGQILDGIKLTQLTQLVLDKVKVNHQDINALLRSAPSIRTIEISRCPNIVLEHFTNSPNIKIVINNDSNSCMIL